MRRQLTVVMLMGYLACFGQQSIVFADTNVGKKVSPQAAEAKPDTGVKTEPKASQTGSGPQNKPKTEEKSNKLKTDATKKTESLPKSEGKKQSDVNSTPAGKPQNTTAKGTNPDTKGKIDTGKTNGKAPGGQQQKDEKATLRTATEGPKARVNLWLAGIKRMYVRVYADSAEEFAKTLIEGLQRLGVDAKAAPSKPKPGDDTPILIVLAKQVAPDTDSYLMTMIVQAQVEEQLTKSNVVAPAIVWQKIAYENGERGDWKSLIFRGLIEIIQKFSTDWKHSNPSALEPTPALER